MRPVTVDEALETIGTGPFQYRLLGIFGLVWAADAMQVLAIGFAAPSLAASFGLTIPQAIQAGTAFFLGMLVGAWGFGRLADRIGRRKVLIVTVLIDAVFGLASVFAHDFTLLLALRLLTGIGVGGTLPVDYAMMAEFLPPKRRGRWLVALEGFWAVGTVAVALAAWAANFGREIRPGAGCSPQRRCPRSSVSGFASGCRNRRITCCMPVRSSRRGRSSTASPPPTGRRRPLHRSAATTRRAPGCAICWGRTAAAHAPDPGRLAPGFHGLLRRVHLAAWPAGHPRLRLRARLRLPGAARSRPAAGLRAGGYRHRDHRPPPHARRLPVRQCRRLPAVRPGRAAGLDRHRPARHELRPARHLGRSLRLHARALSNAPCAPPAWAWPVQWPASAAC